MKAVPATGQGLYWPDESRALEHLCAQAPPGGVLLELGTFFGNSAQSLVKASDGRLVVLVDPWKVTEWFIWERWTPEQAKESVRGVISSKVPALAIPARGADLRGLWHMPISLIHQDDDHHEITVRENLEIFARHILPGGFICLHDWDNPGPHKAWREWPGKDEFEDCGIVGRLKIFRRKDARTATGTATEPLR